MIIRIPTRFPNLNDYINRERANRFAGAKMKKDWTRVAEAASTLALEMNDKYDGFFPATIYITVFEPDNRRDVDNVSAFVNKVCLDGMVKAGVIPDDSRRYVKKIVNEVITVKNKEEVGVEIKL